jgi:hypothetical protein
MYSRVGNACRSCSAPAPRAFRRGGHGDSAPHGARVGEAGSATRSGVPSTHRRRTAQILLGDAVPSSSRAGTQALGDAPSGDWYNSRQPGGWSPRPMRPQLVVPGKPKTLGVLDDRTVASGYVDADPDHRRRHQEARLAIGKAAIARSLSAPHASVDHPTRSESGPVPDSAPMRSAVSATRPSGRSMSRPLAPAPAEAATTSSRRSAPQSGIHRMPSRSFSVRRETSGRHRRSSPRVRGIGVALRCRRPPLGVQPRCARARGAARRSRQGQGQNPTSGCNWRGCRETRRQPKARLCQHRARAPRPVKSRSHMRAVAAHGAVCRAAAGRISVGASVRPGRAADRVNIASNATMNCCCRHALQRPPCASVAPSAGEARQ